jgi:hypothetical protein
MNSGIPLQDLYDLSLHQIYQKYDTKTMNTEKINQYKHMIGAM